MADNLKPARRRKIVGDLGATVSQVERKIYRVVDVRAVPDLILNSKTVHEAIVAVAKSMSKHMPSIEGIEITTENDNQIRSEEHTSELQSLMRLSYAVFCLKTKIT